jgi:uncharacterized protein Ymh
VTSYGTDYLTRLLHALDEFTAAFEAWMVTQTESDHLASRGVFPTVWLRDGVELAQARELELRVAETAGAASRAVQVTGAFIAVAGLGALNPIANWSLMASPKALFTPADIRTTAATVRGRLRALIDDAEANSATDLPAFAPSQLHPTIWAAAAAHWTTHQYRVAVREAAEALTQEWKAKLGRTEPNATDFWSQTLSTGGPATPERPKLVWPGPPGDKTANGIREGLGRLATGLNLTVRNVTTHTSDELTEQEGMERLAAYSYLARLLDQCTIDRGPATDSDA